MRRNVLTDASADDLIAEYARIGVEQDDALLRDQTARFNRLFKAMDAIEKELKAGPAISAALCWLCSTIRTCRFNSTPRKPRWHWSLRSPARKSRKSKKRNGHRKGSMPV